MTREKLEGFHCAVEAAIAILGGKYKAIIVWWLTESGTMRYILEFKMPKPGTHYYLQFRGGGPGRIRFDRIRLERIR